MTGQEFQIAFGTELRQHDDRLEIPSDDIFYWLNKAQKELVRSMFTGMNPKRESFEESEEVIDALRILLEDGTTPKTTVQPTTILNNSVKETKYQLPGNYLWMVAFYVKDTSNNYITCKHVLSDKLYATVLDPFKRPKRDLALYSIRKEDISVYHLTSTIVDTAYITYIRVPVDITRKDGCELPEFLHYRIVELAVNLFLAKQPQNN